LTITICYSKQLYDIIVNPECKIHEVLSVLSERNMIPSLEELSSDIFSERQQKNISMECTFKEAYIYQGDKLLMIQQGRDEFE